MDGAIKRIILWVIGVPEGEERQKKAENLFKEIIVDNFPNLGRDSDIQVHETPMSPNKINLKRSPLRHIKIKLSKSKPENLKSNQREKDACNV